MVPPNVVLVGVPGDPLVMEGGDPHCTAVEHTTINRDDTRAK